MKFFVRLSISFVILFSSTWLSVLGSGQGKRTSTSDPETSPNTDPEVKTAVASTDDDNSFDYQWDPSDWDWEEEKAANPPAGATGAKLKLGTKPLRQEFLDWLQKKKGWTDNQLATFEAKYFVPADDKNEIYSIIAAGSSGSTSRIGDPTPKTVQTTSPKTPAFLNKVAEHKAYLAKLRAKLTKKDAKYEDDDLWTNYVNGLARMGANPLALASAKSSSSLSSSKKSLSSIFGSKKSISSSSSGFAEDDPSLTVGNSKFYLSPSGSTQSLSGSTKSLPDSFAPGSPKSIASADALGSTQSTPSSLALNPYYDYYFGDAPAAASPSKSTSTFKVYTEPKALAEVTKTQKGSTAKRPISRSASV